MVTPTISLQEHAIIVDQLILIVTNVKETFVCLALMDSLFN